MKIVSKREEGNSSQPGCHFTLLYVGVQFIEPGDVLCGCLIYNDRLLE